MSNYVVMTLVTPMPPCLSKWDLIYWKFLNGWDMNPCKPPEISTPACIRIKIKACK